MASSKLINRAAVAVDATAGGVVVAAANPTRKRIILQQTTANPVRIGASGVTAATGIHLGQWDKLELSGDDCPTDAIHAIREGGVNGEIVVIEYAET